LVLVYLEFLVDLEDLKDLLGLVDQLYKNFYNFTIWNITGYTYNPLMNCKSRLTFPLIRITSYMPCPEFLLHLLEDILLLALIILSSKNSKKKDSVTITHTIMLL
jgi:hypothetical protein